MDITYPLFKHQQDAVNFAVLKKNCAIFHEMGLGKTRTALEIYKEMRVSYPGLKLLVICPVSLIEAAWGEDIKRFTGYTYNNVRATCAFTDADINIINYERVIRPAHYKLVYSYLSAHQVMMICDESGKLKNYRAKITKTLLSLSSLARIRLVLSGTPAPNDETEYWGQITFINPNVFGTSFFKFRNTYFDLMRGNSILVQQGAYLSRSAMGDLFKRGWKYGLKPEKRVKLLARIAPYCHYATKETALDLPERLDVFRLIDMSAPQRKIYNDMKKQLVAELNGTVIIAQVALTKIMKLRQITSGFILDPMGAAHTVCPESPKITEVMDVLDEAGPQQVILWCNFIWEVETLKAALGDRAITIYGKTADKDSAIRAFRDNNVQYLIANINSLSHGVTFTRCSLNVFVSLSYSSEQYLQAKSRIHRIGQTKKCTYIHLLCKSTIDESIYAVLQKKGKMADLLGEFTHARIIHSNDDPDGAQAGVSGRVYSETE